MASTKFTKKTINVNAESILHYTNELLNALKIEDTFESLYEVDRLATKISDELDNISFRLRDCDEY